MILAECQFRKRPMSSPVYLAMMYSTMTRNAAKPIFIIAAVRWRLIWIRLCSTIKRTVEVSRRSMSAGIRPDETVTATHPKPIQNQIQRDGREMGRKRWGGGVVGRRRSPDVMDFLKFRRKSSRFCNSFCRSMSSTSSMIGSGGSGGGTCMADEIVVVASSSSYTTVGASRGRF